jgi:hypothetical protein
MNLKDHAFKFWWCKFLKALTFRGLSELFVN